MKTLLFPGLCFLILLAGCSDSPKTTIGEPGKAAEQPVEPLTGQSALFKIYQVARTWASDAMILKMNSIPMSEVPDVRGKAGAWEVTFFSGGKAGTKSYTYSVVEGQGTLHLGVFGGAEQAAAQGSKADPFLIGDVKVDTDAAYKTARAKAGEYERKSPGQRISFLLEKNPKYPNPVWRVIWGDSVAISGFSVLVDATTGEYRATLH